jgi:hypothetical protein
MTNEEATAVQRDLKRNMEGVVIRAGDPGYTETVSIDNGRVDRKPRLVAIPFSTEDVAAIVRFCCDHKIRLTTKSGGHGATGYCLNLDGMVLDLSKLNSIHATAGDSRLTAGTGTRWIQLYDYLQRQQSKYMVIGGGCGTVGIGGYLLGGGYSFVSRSYGLASDNLKAMDVVAADGQVYHLDESLTNPREKDLFWALRGGGGGNFGIVTQVELQLHQAPTDRMMMGQTAFPIERLSEMLDFYNSWVLTLPPEMAVYGMLRRFPDPRNGGQPTLCLHLNPIYNGRFSDGLTLLQPLLEMQPASIELYSMTLPEWENYVGNGTALSGRSAYIRSTMLGPGKLNTGVADICIQYLTDAPSLDSFTVWTHAGGKIREFGGDASSFAHRDAEFVFELKSIWDSSSPQDARANIEWAVDFFDALEIHSQGAYVNYIDPLLLNWQTQYYRHLYGRLMNIKGHWDSTGQFDFQQGIGSQFSPNRVRPLDISPLHNT